MSRPLVSVVIPYRNRPDNLRLALESLAEQTLDPARFEVVIGAMEYDERYVRICREFTDRLTLVSVLSAHPWQVGAARNLAIRQATGDVLVLMDVDMALPTQCLEDLHATHFAFGQWACVVGQMIDYDNNTGDVTEVDVRPYEYYRKLLADLETGPEVAADPRVTARHVIPWAFAWTALIALPRDLVTGHGLTFDPGFHGYGVEDLEWAYRVCRTGTPITMGRGFFGVHLPHLRSVAANKRTEAPNYRYFLRKWPGLDVELACALGDFEANAAYRDYRSEIARVAGDGATLAVLRGELDGAAHLVLGAVVDEPPPAPGSAAPLDPARLDPGRVGAAVVGEKLFTVTEVLPIAGLALPYDDASARGCRVLPAVLALPERYRDRIVAEARRVSATPVTLPGA